MTDEEHEPEEHGWGLIMPFTVCQSQGGPFDDDSFVAGYRCGAADALLAQPDTVLYDISARTGDLPQLDLIAMRRGFKMEVTGAGDEWHRVKFERLSV